MGTLEPGIVNHRVTSGKVFAKARVPETETRHRRHCGWLEGLFRRIELNPVNMFTWEIPVIAFWRLTVAEPWRTRWRAFGYSNLRGRPFSRFAHDGCNLSRLRPFHIVTFRRLQWLFFFSLWYILNRVGKYSILLWELHCVKNLLGSYFDTFNKFLQRNRPTTMYGNLPQWCKLQITILFFHKTPWQSKY